MPFFNQKTEDEEKVVLNYHERFRTKEVPPLSPELQSELRARSGFQHEESKSEAKGYEIDEEYPKRLKYSDNFKMSNAYIKHNPK